VYCNNSLITLDDIPIKYESSETTRAMGFWVNQYNTYPAHASFGGVKESGFGRETIKWH
jgi:acyl-CoA reductase-like NAD-dependent aldehyde dehydrogenase